MAYSGQAIALPVAQFSLRPSNSWQKVIKFRITNCGSMLSGTRLITRGGNGTTAFVLAHKAHVSLQRSLTHHNTHISCYIRHETNWFSHAVIHVRAFPGWQTWMPPRCTGPLIRSDAPPTVPLCPNQGSLHWQSSATVIHGYTRGHHVKILVTLKCSKSVSLIRPPRFSVTRTAITERVCCIHLKTHTRPTKTCNSTMKTAKNVTK